MITTKKGDKGETSCGGHRVAKDDLLVEVIGQIDELQAVLQIVGGVDETVDYLVEIMGILACDSEGCKFLDIEERVRVMEKEIKGKDFNLNSFAKFKNKKAAEFNWARTICRRVERQIVKLTKKKEIDEAVLKYFNRLSDYLFVKSLEEN